MARLIPKVEVEEIAVKSERDTARFLMDQLPNDCVIYHSYPWLKTDRNDRGINTIKEGETDFIIIIPSHGMLILEVKGGEITYDEASRKWSRVLPNGRLKPIQDPFEQANRNTHYLEKLIKKRGYPNENNLPFTYGYAVGFPDCEYNGQTPPGSEPAIIFSAGDLPYLGRRITSALNQWSRSAKPNRLSHEDLTKIQKAISPVFNLLPVLSRTLEDQEEKLFRLTQEQTGLLEFLGQTQRACIEGVAGSGKTMLAQAQAERFADEGKSTLFVCYNKTLAHWINDAIADEYRDKITVKHFHGLCAEWANKANINFSISRKNSDEFWKDEAADLLMDAIDLIPERFDAVIVDEGQDFFPSWWIPLEMINSNGDEGAMYVFYDPRQNLYIEHNVSLPALGIPLNLKTNCRNTRLIVNKCSQILDVEIMSKPWAPAGSNPIEHTLKLASDIKKIVEQHVREWVKEGKLKPSQVAILCPNKKERSSIKDLDITQGIDITQSIDAWRENKAVLFSTVKNFKGLEADAVILIDVPKVDDASYFKKADYYVACSRAKHLLVILHKEG